MDTSTEKAQNSTIYIVKNRKANQFQSRPMIKASDEDNIYIGNKHTCIYTCILCNGGNHKTRKTSIASKRMTFVRCNDRKLLAFCIVDKNKSETKYTTQQLHSSSSNTNNSRDKNRNKFKWIYGGITEDWDEKNGVEWVREKERKKRKTFNSDVKNSHIIGLLGYMKSFAVRLAETETEM